MNDQQSEQLAVYWTQARPTVAAYVASGIRDFHQAEDVLNQVAVTIVRKFDSYDTEAPFVNWAIGIARFEVLKHRRNAATDKLVLGESIISSLADAYQELSPELDERRSLLKFCIDKLRGNGRKALELRYFKDRKSAEVAKQLKISPGAARTLLHRTRAKVRHCIESNMNKPGDQQ